MIIRRRHTANFTTIGNVLFEDERLAADEVGILAYLLSRPHDWEVRRPALMRRWNMGRDAIKRVISNLVRFGWCQPEKTRLANGTFHFIYEIRDEPGATLTDEEVRRALSLVSGEAAPDDLDGSFVRSDEHPVTVDPPTPYPSLADPSPDNPSLAYKDIQNNDLPKTDSTQKIEREHERAKEKHALNLAEFKRRWPTTAADDQGRVDRAWFALTLDEGETALAGIVPFLEHLKKLNKKHPPAGWRYLEEKRWTLLDQTAKAGAVSTGVWPRDSLEAKAITVLYEIANRMQAIRSFMRLSDGSISFLKTVTPQLAALAQAGPQTDWVVVSHNQAGAWEGLLRQFFEPGLVRKHFKEGDRAPWPWPPSAEGKIYAAETGPPQGSMSDNDMADFK